MPDLPLEEAAELRGECDARGVALVPLVAPTTPPERLAAIGAAARGFLYTVSVVGTTGERAARDRNLAELAAANAGAGANEERVDHGERADFARSGMDDVVRRRLRSRSSGDAADRRHASR